MRFLRSQADFLSALAFLCCYIFDLYGISWLLALTLNMHTSMLIFGVYIVLSSPYIGPFKSIFSQSRCSLEPNNFLRVPALLTLTRLAFPQILFPASFYDIQPGHDKMA